MPFETRLAREKEFPFISKYESLAAILADHELAALGDAYVNFLYSLVLSKRLGKPAGRKVNSSILASSLRQAGLRKLLPSRTDRHRQADAAEALIVYAWLVGATSLEESIRIMEKGETAEGAFNLLLQTTLKRIDLVHEKV